MAEKTSNSIALLVYKNRDGGVERLMVNLALGLMDAGIEVELIISDKTAPFVADLKGHAGLVCLPECSRRAAVAALRKAALARRWSVIVTGKPADDRLLWQAVRGLGDLRPRLVFGIGTCYSRQIAEKRLPFWRRYFKVRRRSALYNKADAVVATSRWVGDDIIRTCSVAPRKLSVIGNAIISKDFYRRADKPLAAELQPSEGMPLILAVGRLSAEKDYPTLIRAFARLRAVDPAQLVILGEGRERTTLQQLISQLDLQHCVRLPGFVANPLPLIKRADLLVVSSLWEGFGNTLIEAMALGTPVVSTRCPGGPPELLADGKYGALVDVGDSSALAEAMTRTLLKPTATNLLQQGAAAYSVEAVSARYITLFDAL